MAVRYGLDQPLWVQYVKYLEGVVTFDFGLSFFQNDPVKQIIFQRAQYSVALMGTAILIAYTVGTLLGALAGWWYGSTFDRVTLTTLVFARAVPSFLLGLLFLYVFAVHLNWFPTGGSLSLDNSATGLQVFLTADFYHHLFLPVVSVVPFLMAYPVLLMRTTIVGTLDEDFITMARARGIKERRVFTHHGVRNSLIPIVSTMPIVISLAVAGNVLIETIYSWPGLGRTLVESVQRGDYPLSQGAFLMIALIVIIGNFIVDMIYMEIDPRVTYD
jgi:peptide/nickel transport system permease protein